MNDKYCFIDLDGTLLSKTKKIKSRTIESLINLSKNDAEIIICTGRWPISANQINNEIEKSIGKRNKYLISLNGAYIEDLQKNEVIFCDFIREDVFKKLLIIQKKFKVAIWIYSKNGIKNKIIYSKGIPIKNIVSKFNYGKVVEFNDKLSLDGDSKIKVLFMSPFASRISKVFNWLNQYFSNYLSIIRTSSNNIEITNKNINKGTAIEKIIKIENLKINQTYGLGDSGNDIPMFNQVGYRISFGDKNKELLDLSNVNYKNNKFLPEALNKISSNEISSFNSKIKKLNIKINNINDNLYKLNVSKYDLLWRYNINQNKIKIEIPKYSYWVTKKILLDFFYNENFEIYSNNNCTVFSMKEKKFIFSKSFSDTQIDLIKNILSNNKIQLFVLEKDNGNTILYYLDLKIYMEFLSENKFLDSDFSEIKNINDLNESELKKISSITFYKSEIQELDSDFLINKRKNLLFILNNANNKIDNNENVITIDELNKNSMIIVEKFLQD